MKEQDKFLGHTAKEWAMAFYDIIDGNYQDGQIWDLLEMPGSDDDVDKRCEQLQDMFSMLETNIDEFATPSNQS